jgi:putative glycosyltransferase (TIGR04348 family)
MRIALITPALHDANNGNWQTAQRWAAMLGEAHLLNMAKSWDALPTALANYGAMIALHARRSAASVAAFAEQCPYKPLIVVLTGTDLYRDIVSDGSAQASLQFASKLVVLQEQGIQDLPMALRYKAFTVFQSAPRKSHQTQASKALEVCVVGHLRTEKSPEMVFALAAQLAALSAPIRLSHVGKALDDALAAQAQGTKAAYSHHYRWLGGLDHSESLAIIARSDVLLHPSAIEGGALAIIEAIQSGTPVIASRIAGHVGLLGSDYLGFFDWGDAAGAAALLQRFGSDAVFNRKLRSQCEARSALFAPDTERRNLLNLLTI